MINNYELMKSTQKIKFLLVAIVRTIFANCE